MELETNFNLINQKDYDGSKQNFNRRYSGYNI